MPEKSPVPEWFGQPEVKRGMRPASPSGGGGRPGLVLVAVIVALGAAGASFYLRSAPSRETSVAVLEQKLAQAESEKKDAERRAQALEREIAAMRSNPPPVATPTPPVPDEAPPAGPADADATESSGTSSTKDIAATLDGARNKFKRCYQVGLQAQPDAEGRITLRIQILPSGDVAGAVADVSGNLPNETRDCVVRVTRTLRFSKASEPRSVSYPLIFTKA